MLHAVIAPHFTPVGLDGLRRIGRTMSGMLTALVLLALTFAALHAHEASHAATTCVVCVAGHAPAEMPAVPTLRVERPAPTAHLTETPRLAPPAAPVGAARGRAPPQNLA